MSAARKGAGATRPGTGKATRTRLTRGTAMGVAQIDPQDLDALRARSLGLPVEGMEVARLHDGFAEARGPRVHRALDILAPRGTRVLAVDDGVLKKLYTSTGGGLTIYQFDPSETFCYYYAHLDAYAPFLEDGTVVRKGDLIGYVGTTGNAPPDTPHLHFTVFKLSAARRWWEGTPINPYPLFTAVEDRQAE